MLQCVSPPQTPPLARTPSYIHWPIVLPVLGSNVSLGHTPSSYCNMLICHVHFIGSTCWRLLVSLTPFASVFARFFSVVASVFLRSFCPFALL